MKVSRSAQLLVAVGPTGLNNAGQRMFVIDVEPIDLSIVNLPCKWVMWQTIDDEAGLLQGGSGCKSSLGS